MFDLRSNSREVNFHKNINNEKNKILTITQLIY